MPRRRNPISNTSTDHNTSFSIIDGGTENSKIRKRGCYSSSPSSSTTTRTNSSAVAQHQQQKKKSSSKNNNNQRLKRAIVLSSKRRVGSSRTPVPSWKMQDFMRSPGFANNGGGKESGSNTNSNSQLSARRLGATLWEINGMKTKSQSSSPVVAAGSIVGEAVEEEEREESSRSSGRNGGRRRRMYSGGGGDEMGYGNNLLCRSPAGYPHMMGDQVARRSPAYEKNDGSKKAQTRTTARHRRRSSAASQKLEITEYLDQSTTSSIAIDPAATIQQVDHHHTTAIDIRSRLKDIRNSLQTSKELTKLLLKTWQNSSSSSSSNHNSSRLTLVTALRVELTHAQIHINNLIQNQLHNTNHNEEIKTLLRQFAAEKSAWKRREHDRILESVGTVTDELEAERKLRKRVERMNKRLGRELAETRSELDIERRAREVLEQTCEELLARSGGGVCDEEGELELRRVREEVEKEREMLIVADVLREERVQMKLQEARYEYEEKNAAVEKLRCELEVYLNGVKAVVDEEDCGKEDDGKEIGGGSEVVGVAERNGVSEFLSKLRKGTSFLTGKRQHHHRQKKGSHEVKTNKGDEELEDDDDSHELHSIEVNMDEQQQQQLTMAAAAGLLLSRSDSRPRMSVEEVFKGRRSLSEKIQWESICLQRKTSADEMSSKFKLQQQQMIINGNRRLSSSSSHGSGDQKQMTTKMNRKSSSSSHGSSSSEQQKPPSSSKTRKDRVLMMMMAAASSSSSPARTPESFSPFGTTGAGSGKRFNHRSGSIDDE